VKTTRLMAAMAAVIVLAISAVWAQHTVQPGTYRPPARTAARAPQTMPIAVIDIQYIFKNYNLHKARRDEMKTRLQRANEQMKQDITAVRGQAERLKEFRPGTPDYKALEEQVTKQDAALAVRRKMLQREFQEEEARMINDTYKAIWDEVDNYCRSTGTMMVMQCDREPIDTARPNDIVRLATRQVVWHSGHDITNHILDVLNDRYLKVTGRPGVGVH